MRRIIITLLDLLDGVGLILLYPLVVLFPRNPKKILFGAWGGDKFADNPLYFMRYLQVQNKGYKCYWVGNWSIRKLVKDAKGVTFVWKGSPLVAWHVLTASWMCCNIRIKTDITSFPTYGRVKQINFWHGTGFKGAKDDSIGVEKKQVGTLLKVFYFFKYGIANKARTQACYATVSSEAMVKKMPVVAPWSFAEERSIAAGSPRIDYLINRCNDKTYVGQLKEKYSKILNISADKRWYLYLPTWRKGLSVKFSFASSERINEFQSVLAKHDAVLIEKQHPQVLKELGLQGSIDENICVVSAGQAAQIDVQELMIVADVLITDYSSVCCDYAPMKRPVIHWAYDYKWYVDVERNGLDDFPLKEFAAGPVAYNEDEMLAALDMSDKDMLAKQCPRFNEIIAAEKGHACETFAKWMGMI